MRLNALRDKGERVVTVNYNGEPAWLVLSYEDVAQIYTDEENLPGSAAYKRHSEPVMGRMMLAMDGDEHRINRLLVSKAFHPKAIRELAESLLYPLANELIDGFAGKIQIDIVEDYAHKFPFSVITRMLGIPVEDNEQMIYWVNGLFSYPWAPEEAKRISAEFTEYLAEVVRDRRRHPRADLISQLTQAEAEGQHLSDEEIYSFIRLLFPAGADTTFYAISSLMLTVLSEPGLKQRLLEHPADRSKAVDESLRLNGTIVLQSRYTEKAVTIAGTDIPANSWLLYGIGPANRDPNAFPEPDRFDLDRKPGKPLTFGKGPHFCLGSHLARAEMSVSLDVLLDRLQGLRLVEPGDSAITHVVLRGPRHLAVNFDKVLPPIQSDEFIGNITRQS
ncbi:MAG: cytochrome P450 [Pseudomonadales bacterium]